MKTLQEKYENMVRHYRGTQRQLKEAINILKSYDGSRAIDEWDYDTCASKEWETKANNFSKRYK